jgi:hypothetical protein
MLSSTCLFVNGINATISGGVDTAHAPPTLAAGGETGRDLLDQYVSVYQSNGFLSAELKSVTQKLSRARTYLESPGSNPILAHVHLQQLKAHHSAVLTLLRANRLQARALLARTETRPVVDVA